MDTLKNYLEEALQIPDPQDCRHMSVDAIVTGICSQVNRIKDDGVIRNDAFYAGICKDVRDNKPRHGNDCYVVLVAMLVLFAVAYSKQTKYIVSRIDYHAKYTNLK